MLEAAANVRSHRTVFAVCRERRTLRSCPRVTRQASLLFSLVSWSLRSEHGRGSIAIASDSERPCDGMSANSFRFALDPEFQTGKLGACVRVNSVHGAPRRGATSRAWHGHSYLCKIFIYRRCLAAPRHSWFKRNHRFVRARRNRGIGLQCAAPEYSRAAYVRFACCSTPPMAARLLVCTTSEKKRHVLALQVHAARALSHYLHGPTRCHRRAHP